MATLKLLMKHLWPHGRVDLKLRVVVAMVSLALAKVVGVYTPFLYKRAVDSLSVTDLALALPIAMIVAYGAARILSHFFSEFRDFVFARVSQHAQRTVALDTFKHLHNLSLSFHLERHTGGLSRIIDRGTHAIQFVLTFMLFNILPTIVEIALVTGILYIHFGITYALVVFLTIGAYIAYTFNVSDWRVKHKKEMNESDNAASSRAVDSLLNFETVKYFNNEEHEYRRFDQGLARYEAAAVRSQVGLSVLNAGQGAIIGIGLVVLMWMAAQGIVSGKQTLGDFVLVNSYLLQLFIPLNFLGFVYSEVKQSLVDINKMFELLDVKSDVKDIPDAKPLQVTEGAVEFRDVWFQYENGRKILSGVSFKIPSGKTVAVVGPSGAGKSTLSRLLFRFYDVQKGGVFIDGQDIRQVTQNSLRAAIGIVPQDTVLFNDSIKYNIQYGRPAATEEEVFAAARFAKIHDFAVSLPKGYDTLVGERGLKLSGGEKQRVAIARTILKGPPVLVFDEATSALDSHTEKDIQASLEEVSARRTTLMIAHRLSTVIHADEILVLKDGVIAERGKHHELLERGGEYARLWKRQLEATRTNPPPTRDIEFS